MLSNRRIDWRKGEQMTEQLCSNCNGSGEGMYDGTICHVCKGHGTILVDDDGQESDDESL